MDPTGFYENLPSPKPKVTTNGNNSGSGLGQWSVVESSSSTTIDEFPKHGVVQNMRKNFEKCNNSNEYKLSKVQDLNTNTVAPAPATRPKPSPTTSEDWDFLAKLNDILKSENFYTSNSVPASVPAHVSCTSGINASNPVPVPIANLSPRPPRPARRSDRRKADFLKARSMDAGAALDNLDYSNPPPIGPPRCISPFMRYNSSSGGNLFNDPNGTNLNYFNGSPMTPDPAVTRFNNLSTSPASEWNGGRNQLLNGVNSSSLDSIYDQLNSRQQQQQHYQNGPGNFYGGRKSPNFYPFSTPGSVSNYPGSNVLNGSYGGATSSVAAAGGAQYRGSTGNAYQNNIQSLASPSWFPNGLPPSTSYGSFKGSLLGLDYEDRLLRLESDKESLHLQVSCLSDQIDAQTSKIHDLEKLLDDKRNVLESTEDSLQRELLTRSSLETQKLELLTEISSLRLKHASLERENFELKDRIVGGNGRVWDKPPHSSPSQNNIIDSTTNWQVTSRTLDGGSPHKIQRPKTPPASAYRRVEQSAFGTIPRRSQVSTDVLNKNASFGNIHAITNGNGSKPSNVPISYQLQLKPLHCSESFRQPVGGYYPSSGGASVGLYLASETGNRSTSAPNLAAIEREEWERRNSGSASKKSPGSHKSRGILRILGKLKRSNSGGLDNEVSPEGSAFVRGGFRSTATPRLGWMKEPLVQKPDGPITSWDSNNVILWLNYLGLAMYSNEVKRWVKTGQQLLDASMQELEKELGIKNALHRKKLNLALHCLKHPEEEDNAGKLDYHWVIRWLDDVGLPQYKETFADARVDGRVLSHLTAEDLFTLKVTSLLHHSSLKRGIQLLRIHKFHPGCLCRRGAAPFEDEGPKSVATWTNHRVMEWLKAIDLAEYAPNLRGSGVHGALIIFEPKFNAELLSTLLSIPGNKTLLRRHLSLQVNELVGRYIVQEKRVIELSPDFVPINPTIKVKPPKSAKVFRLKSKRLSNDAPEELLCPMEWNTYPSPDGLITSMESFDAATTNGGEKVSNI